MEVVGRGGGSTCVWVATEDVVVEAVTGVGDMGVWLGAGIEGVVVEEVEVLEKLGMVGKSNWLVCSREGGLELRGEGVTLDSVEIGAESKQFEAVAIKVEKGTEEHDDAGEYEPGIDCTTGGEGGL
jgi:hypothetical protein